jgi:hypothetical protein
VADGVYKAGTGATGGVVSVAFGANAAVDAGSGGGGLRVVENANDVRIDVGSLREIFEVNGAAGTQPSEKILERDFGNFSGKFGFEDGNAPGDGVGSKHGNDNGKDYEENCDSQDAE